MKIIIARLKNIWDLVRLPWIMLRLIINPMNIEPIFSLGTFRDHRAFRLSKEKMFSDPGMKSMIDSRYLAEGKIDLQSLNQLPDGTLGKEFARFMLSKNLVPEFYQIRKEILADEFVYVRKRGPQTHDIWHIVTGVDVDPPGEMKLSAFYVAQIRSPLNALFLSLGLFYVIFKKPELLETYFDAVTEGWILGKKAKPLFAMKWEEMWNQSLVDIRMELNLPLTATGISKIDSVLPSLGKVSTDQPTLMSSQG